MFKKFICLYFFISITYTSHSQTFEDVLRYSSFYNEGTARFNSMGGAFGALGGDLSAISINPADHLFLLTQNLDLPYILKILILITD